jgi:hypothetical protein
MKPIRISSGTGTTPQEILKWLDANVGKSNYRNTTDILGTEYIGQGWSAHWKHYGHYGWFLDVKINDPKHAAFFTLRWK